MNTRINGLPAASFLALLLAAFAGSATSRAAPQRAQAASAATVDWPVVSKATDRPLAVESPDVHAVELPHFDLKVLAEGMRLSPHMELLTETNSKAVRGGKALMIGEATASKAEAQPFTGAPEQGGNDPCAGPSALLALLDRPTIADSACSVKPYKTVLETGYDNQIIHAPNGQRLVDYPQAEWRYGLPGGWEAKLFWPNYNRLSPHPGPSETFTGLSDAGIGLKKEFGYFGNWVFAADTRIDFPTGASAFTNGGTQITLNGIASYNVTPQFGLAAQFGVARLSERGPNGRTEYYYALEPIVVASYAFFDRLQLYGEVYGTTNAGPNTTGGAYWFDGGLQYLITPRLEVDIEEGAALSGPQGASAHYFGFGVGVEF